MKLVVDAREKNTPSRDIIKLLEAEAVHIEWFSDGYVHSIYASELSADMP